LDELERVVRLGFDIDADDIEPGTVVADSRAAGSAEQVQQKRPLGASVTLAHHEPFSVLKIV